MAEAPNPVMNVEHTHLGVSNAPHEAQIIESSLPHLRYAVAVTQDNGLEVQPLDEHDAQAFPHRAKGERTVADLDSFLSELDRRELMADAGTLWGNVDRGQITAVYNDHTTDVAGWRDDKLTLKLTQDRDWATWHQLSGHYYRQEEFGDKIEELLHTITSPDQAELLEVIDSVRASSTGEFESGITRANGAQNLVYKTEITTRAGRTGQLEIPQTITLRLRPWEGHPQLYDIEAYFRVRITDGKLTLAIKLKPTRQILRDAWKDLTQMVANAIAKPVYAQP